MKPAACYRMINRAGGWDESELCTADSWICIGCVPYRGAGAGAAAEVVAAAGAALGAVGAAAAEAAAAGGVGGGAAAEGGAGGASRRSRSPSRNPSRLSQSPPTVWRPWTG